MKPIAWRLIAAGALLPFAAMLGTSTASAEIDVKSIKAAVVWVDVSWEGIVHVTYTDDTTEAFDADYLGMCSGWIASPVGHVVTAGHCVRTSDNVRLGLIIDVIDDQELVRSDGSALDPRKVDWKVEIEPVPTIRIGQPAVVTDRVFTTSMTAQLLDSQDFEAGDNALLQVANFDTSSAVLAVAEAAPEVLDKVTSVGFPQDTARITEVDRQDPTFKPGEISSKIVSTKGVPQLQLNGELIGGMSGGPTVNADGRVVGVNSSSFTGYTQSYVTDTNALRTFLSRNAVPLTSGPVASAAPDTPAAPAEQAPATLAASGIPGWMWGIIGLLVGGVAVLAALLLKNRRVAAAPLARQAPVGQVYAPPAAPGGPWQGGPPVQQPPQATWPATPPPNMPPNAPPS